jgi:adenylate cyclase
VKKAVQRSPDSYFNYMVLDAVYASLDHQEEAEATSKKVLEINPNFSIEIATKALPFKPADLKLFRDALYKAGLPYSPPLPLPDKPSIAVLAFDNLSGDPEQEYFSDGIAENIITALSSVGELFVIARNSSFTYKGKPVKVQQVSRELGVRYVLEGSVQKSGDRLRITAQLIDAKNGQHLWAERYGRDFKDIFEVQDDITMKIVNALRLKLTDGEQARILSKQINNFDAYLKHMQAVSEFNKGTPESLIRYSQLSQEIIDLEPESPLGYRLLAMYYYGLARLNKSPRESTKKAYNLLQKAISLDEFDAISYGFLASIYEVMRKYEKAVASGMRAVELAPNSAMVHGLFGKALGVAGRFDEGITHLKQAIRLNPFPPYWYYYQLGMCYRLTGQYEDSLAEFKKALQRAPDAASVHGNLAIAYILLNQEQEARISATKALELNPNLSVSYVEKTWRYKDQVGLKLTVDAMRKTGFPE